MVTKLIAYFRLLARAVYPRPWGVCAWGKGSVILWPWRIQGAANLQLGDDVIIQGHSWLGAVAQWGEQVFSPASKSVAMPA